MAVGDRYTPAIVTVAQNSYANLQPPVGTEVVVHNIAHSTDATLEKFDGTIAITTDAQTGTKPWMGMNLHCTNSVYYRVKNTNATDNNIGWDGVVTKEE